MLREVGKYLILGTLSEVDLILSRAQEAGCLELIAPDSGRMAHQLSPQSEMFLKAIKILRRFPSHAGGSVSSTDDEAWGVAENVVRMTEEITHLTSELKLLGIEQDKVAPYGAFSTETMRWIEAESGRKFRFFCAKTTTVAPDDCLYIATRYDLNYFITLTPPEAGLDLPQMLEIQLTTSSNEIQDRIQQLGARLNALQEAVRYRVSQLPLLEEALRAQLNHDQIHAAKHALTQPLNNGLFAVTAWVPRHKIAMFRNLVNSLGVYLEEVALDPNDRVPTYFENSGLSEVGEDLVKIYDVPAATDHDPSPFVIGFFALFFAVIVGDAGYGGLFLLTAWYLKRRFPNLRGAQRRALRLFFLTSMACVVWGVAIASYFGLKLPPNHPLMRCSPLHYLVVKKTEFHGAMKDDVYQVWVTKFPAASQAVPGRDMLMAVTQQKKHFTTYPMMEEFSTNIVLELSLLIGIIHVTVGICRYLRRNIAGLGWICFMWGGYLFFPSFLKATTIAEFMGWVPKATGAAFGLQCLWGGIIFAVVAAAIQHGKKGLGEIANVVQVFADVLSYLRLYALSLAGAIMASTFNQEGSLLGLFVGFVAIVVGHAINMSLAVMGGVIHGLRLNFLEWYHYCFDGGGRLLQPLRKWSKET